MGKDSFYCACGFVSLVYIDKRATQAGERKEVRDRQRAAVQQHRESHVLLGHGELEHPLSWYVRKSELLIGTLPVCGICGEDGGFSVEAEPNSLFKAVHLPYVGAWCLSCAEKKCKESNSELEMVATT